MESSHRWTFVRYFGPQQVPIGMPGQQHVSPFHGGRHNCLVTSHELYAIFIIFYYLFFILQMISLLRY